MAYVAIASLLQNLEYLLQFPCIILQVKKMQAKTFRDKAFPVMWFLNTNLIYPKDDLEILQKYIENLSLPIAKYVKAVNCNDEVVSQIFEITKSVFGIYRGSQWVSEKVLEMLEQASQISEQVNFIESELNRFIEQTRTKWKTTPCLVVEEVLDILLASHFLMQEITFFHEVIMQTMVLCQNLRFFMTLLGESSNKCHDPQVLRSLENVADRARNFVEDCMIDNPIESEMKYFLDVVNNIATYSLARETNLEKVVKDIFVGQEGVSQYLFQTLEEIHYLKGEIRKVYDKTSNLEVATNSLPEGSSLQNSKQDIVVGIEGEVIKIMEGLTRLPSGLEIVTIVGMGGIGKTTLARQIFQHPFVVYHFDCRAWVIVSQGYNVRDLLLGLLGSVAQPTDEMFRKSNAQLAEQLYRCLKGKRYLIIMDDMWSINAWNDIKRCFPDDKVGSRIIVTSRFTELAIHANPRNPPHYMNLLDLELSLELLEKLVFGKEVCPPQLAIVGKHIARKCKGLPLAIIVVAGLLSQNRTQESWKNIADSVKSNVCTNSEQCLDILSLSYKYLPHHLKACFLYMGAFPEDCEIEVRKMIQIWIAEGLIVHESSKSLEEIAEGFLEDLIDRSLVMVGKKDSRDKIKTCRLHDLLLELCLREARKENFMSVLKGKDQCFPPDASDQRRLSFQLNSDGDVHLAPPYPHLRSFLCFTLGSDFVPDIFFSSLQFKLLRVLDMFFLHFDSFPSQVLELTNLRHLALYVTYRLPISISKLLKLQTLIIHGPWNSRKVEEIQTLSLEYWNMPQLRHLYITVASCLSDPSLKTYILLKQYSKIKPEAARDLQTLSTISFASCKCEIFCAMPHLKKLAICETKQDYSRDSSSDCLNNLIFLQELETLKCSFYLERKRAWRILSWNAIPSGLKQLTLSQSYLPWKNMTFVAKLPNLEVLKLKSYAFQGPEWVPTEAGFCSLKHLLIEESDLVIWEATSNDFPRLQYLILKSCKMLLEIPYSVGAISALQRIELHYCSKSSEISAKNIQDQIDGLDIMIRSD